jgi:hypothetical protein
VLEKKILLEDLILYAGHINIHKYSNQPYKIFTFLLCKVWLGSTGLSSSPQIQACDSVIIPPENEEAFQYNFFVRAHAQYQVRYEVSFSVTEEKELKLTELSCCRCENRVPTMYCATEKLHFCEQCCSEHHRSKLMYTHELDGIDKVNTL